MATERAVGLAVPSWEKTRHVIRATLIRRMVGDWDGPWARMQGVSPFTVTVGGTFTPGVTTVQLYGWNGELLPTILDQQAAPLSDPIIKPGTYTYQAVLDYLAASVRGAGSAQGVTCDVMGVDLEMGF